MTRAHDIDRFQLLWRRCLLEQADDNSVAIHQQLIDAYSEPQRVYHTLNHIEHCLAHLDNISDYLQNPEAVELAALIVPDSIHVLAFILSLLILLLACLLVFI